MSHSITQRQSQTDNNTQQQCVKTIITESTLSVACHVSLYITSCALQLEMDSSAPVDPSTN